MVILGIDPGSSHIGYGLIKKEKNQLSFKKSGLIKIIKKEKKLVEIEKKFEKLLNQTKPDLVVLEKIYFMKNLKSALEVAKAYGIIMLLINKKNIKIIELTPLEVKMGITGYGRADKKAITKMVKNILNIKTIKDHHQADALAAAIVGGFLTS